MMRGLHLGCFFLFAGALWCAEPRRFRHAIVVSGEPNATDAGLAILQAGGNAADAAVTMAFVLGVTHTPMCGLGGGGHALVRMADGRTIFLDFREQAPGKASRNMFLDEKGNLSHDAAAGWRSAAVPGTVRGLEALHKKFGHKPWSELLQPAISLASKGYELSYRKAAEFLERPALANERRLWRSRLRTKSNFEPGDLMVQTDLAGTLDRLARLGANDFYTGETAKRLAAAMETHGGLVTLADLGKFNVSEHQPLQGEYRGYQILTAAGSSSGGIALLETLGILEGSGYEKSGPGSAAAIHMVAESMRRCFADRSENIGDPDFVKIPVTRLLDKKYLAQLRASIDPDHATPSERVKPGKFLSGEGSDTTHFAVVDAEGNAVAFTFTLNGAFGSGVSVPGLGFVLNNNMDNFAANPGKTNQYGLRQGEANAIQPGKRPVSSMTPTIVLREGKLYMVVGTPGGPTIANSVLQAILNVIDFHMNAQDAVAAPRFHHQWYPDHLFLEPGFSPDTIALLKSRGHAIEFKASNNDLNMILVDGGWLQGAVDPRREGKAAGY